MLDVKFFTTTDSEDNDTSDENEEFNKNCKYIEEAKK